jgi:hypothetical protein
VGKHCKNPQCFKEKNYEAKSMKFTVVILNQLNIKNNKIDKDHFEKNHVGNTVVIHSVLKKKTTKLNSQPAQYEKKKSTKTILETKS